MNTVVRWTTIAASVLALGACAIQSPPSTGTKTASTAAGIYKVGNPYQIDGVWYYPKEDPAYTETGIASWYGPGFQGRETANGETFDMNELTAAHRTLPMPSLVQVTNLENGRTVVLRVNDRGPFSRGRVIDVSRKAAQLLGFEKQGTAKVRVAVLANESLMLAQSAQTGGRLADPDKVTLPPTAAPQSAVLTHQLPTPDASAPVVVTAAPAKASGLLSEPITPAEAVSTVPGVTVDGRFLPAPVVDVRPVASTGIFVQAGAFSVIENAFRLKARMSSLGTAELSPVNAGGTILYRVRLGPFATVEEADAMLQRVVGAGASDARIVVE